MKIQQNGDTLCAGEVRELDAANARAFQEAVIDAMTDSVKNVEIDLSQTVFLDSCGLGALIALQKTMFPRGGLVRLLNPSPAAQQLLELTRLHRILEIVKHDEIPAR